MKEKSSSVEKPSIESLRALVGRRVCLGGVVWRVVDVMDDRTELVLESCAAGPAVQADQHGDPRRRVRQRIAVAVFDGGEPAPDFLALELLDE